MSSHGSPSIRPLPQKPFKTGAISSSRVAAFGARVQAIKLGVTIDEQPSNDEAQAPDGHVPGETAPPEQVPPEPGEKPSRNALGTTHDPHPPTQDRQNSAPRRQGFVPEDGLSMLAGGSTEKPLKSRKSKKEPKAVNVDGLSKQKVMAAADKFLGKKKEQAEAARKVQADEAFGLTKTKDDPIRVEIDSVRQHPRAVLVESTKAIVDEYDEAILKILAGDATAPTAPRQRSAAPDPDATSDEKSKQRQRKKLSQSGLGMDIKRWLEVHQKEIPFKPNFNEATIKLLKIIFSALDLDESGTMDMEEFEMVFHLLGMPLKQHELAEALGAKENGKWIEMLQRGELSFGGFLHLLKYILKHNERTGVGSVQEKLNNSLFSPLWLSYPRKHMLHAVMTRDMWAIQKALSRYHKTNKKERRDRPGFNPFGKFNTGHQRKTEKTRGEKANEFWDYLLFGKEPPTTVQLHSLTAKWHVHGPEMAKNVRTKVKRTATDPDMVIASTFHSDVNQEPSSEPRVDAVHDAILQLAARHVAGQAERRTDGFVYRSQVPKLPQIHEGRSPKEQHHAQTDRDHSKQHRSTQFQSADHQRHIQTERASTKAEKSGAPHSDSKLPPLNMSHEAAARRSARRGGILQVEEGE